MYTSIGHFIADWAYESEATLKIFENISNEALSKKDCENVRSIGRLSWHIAITIAEMMNKTGLQVNGRQEHSQPPINIEEIIKAYRDSSISLVEEIKLKWTDKSLAEENIMYGESWKNGKTLSVLIHHQIHHRGQLTILMRLEGLKVPGIYGPAKEDWAVWNMPAAE